MKTLGTHNYYVYMLTNKNRTVLYTGVTNDLVNRLWRHRNPEASERPHFTHKYKCFYWVYYEHYLDVDIAIDSEKQIKGYSRMKKEALIKEFNREWKFLNKEIE